MTWTGLRKLWGGGRGSSSSVLSRGQRRAMGRETGRIEINGVFDKETSVKIPLIMTHFLLLAMVNLEYVGKRNSHSTGSP